MRKSDVWLFRVGSALVTFVALFYGCRHAGRYLHEREADEVAHRTRSEAEEREDALKLSKGWSDTKGYHTLSHRLKAEEMTASFAAPHWVEVERLKIAGVAALLVAILCGESARLWATKKEAQRRITGRYQRQ
jgi:hypothetical protein